MEPTLKNGQVVIVSSLPFLFNKSKVGDIVLFDNEKKFIKRIKEIKGQKYFLTGDNKNDSMDSRKIGWIDKRNIIGKIIFKIS